MAAAAPIKFRNQVQPAMIGRIEMTGQLRNGMLNV
jgi:hypothetical protein